MGDRRGKTRWSVFIKEIKSESQTNNQSSNNNSYSNANTATEPDTFAGNGDTVDISDDELPFQEERIVSEQANDYYPRGACK